MSLLDRLNVWNPAMCRLSARNGRGIMSTRQIAQRSGLKKSLVHEISMLSSWETVPVGVAVAFSSACGIDFLKTQHKLLRLRKWNWSHVIKNLHPNQRRMISRLLTTARNGATKSA